MVDQESLRTVFAEQLRAKREAEAERWGVYAREHPFAREMVAEADAALRRLKWKPRRGKTVEDTPLDSLTEEQRAAVRVVQERYQARVAAVAEPAEARAEAAEVELCRLAELIELRPGEEPREVRSVWTTSYASQGFGAETYARNRAESALDVARALGVRCDVLRVPHLDEHGKEKCSRDWGLRFPTYVARAWLAEELDVEVLRRKMLPLREIVRLMWKRGSNPRVHLPDLPWGYEESVGIDHFGNDLRAGKVPP